MKHGWIIRPNVAYDKLHDLVRLVIMLALLSICYLFGALVLHNGEIGFGIFAIIGLYRIIYHTVMTPEKYKELTEDYDDDDFVKIDISG
jgi:hypothetical protein